MSDLLPTIFEIRRGYEGPQVIISWDEPPDVGSVTSMRLKRRLFGYPIDEDDGDTIFDGAAGAQALSDQAVEAGVCYYYKLFSFYASGVISSKFVEGFIIPLETGFHAEKIWEILPESYKTGDKGQESEEEIRLALTEGTSAAVTPEVFNLSEDGLEQKGPLHRLLKIIGPMLDEPKGLLDVLINQLDVDDACLPNLAHLAKLLGLDLNQELTPEKIRNEVRLQVEFLKLKGTIPGIIARMRSISGLTAVVHEQCNDVFFLNDADSRTPEFTIAELANLGTADDIVHRIAGFPDLTPFWLWFTVYIGLPPGFVLDEGTARKWCLAIDEASPACHKGFLTVSDELEDTIPIAIADESWDEDFAEDTIPVSIADGFTDTQTSFPSNWLIISDPTKTIGAPNWTSVFAVKTIP